MLKGGQSLTNASLGTCLRASFYARASLAAPFTPYSIRSLTASLFVVYLPLQMLVEAFDIIVVRLLDLGCGRIIERSFQLTDRNNISSSGPLLHILLYSVCYRHIDEGKPFDLVFLDDHDSILLNLYTATVEIVVYTVDKRLIWLYLESGLLQLLLLSFYKTVCI